MSLYQVYLLNKSLNQVSLLAAYVVVLGVVPVAPEVLSAPVAHGAADDFGVVCVCSHSGAAETPAVQAGDLVAAYSCLEQVAGVRTQTLVFPGLVLETFC